MTDDINDVSHTSTLAKFEEAVRRSSPGSESAPRFYIVNQHIGWLKQYVIGMDGSNWRDMRGLAERQLEQLSEEIDKEAAALTDAAATPCEASSLIDKRLVDLREANDIFREMDWDKSRDIQRNDRKIRWLIDLHTVLHFPDLAQALSEQQRHAVEHARYQVNRSSPDEPECCFDYQLVETLVEMIDRAYPISSTDRHCGFCYIPMAAVDCCDSEFESKGCPHMAPTSSDRGGK